MQDDGSTPDREIFTIIKASVEDLSVIRQLADEIWPATYKTILTVPQISYMMDMFYSEASLHNQFAKHQFILGKLGRRPVAFASFGPSDDPSIFKLHKIYLAPELQGMGIGRKMIDYVVEAVKTVNATALDLNVNRHNPALGFYQKLGFQIVREEDNDIGNGYWMNDYVMRKQF